MRCGILIAVSADYAYLAAEFPNEPYYVGRIMEFLPPAPQQAEGEDEAEDPSAERRRVRMAWFYRAKDCPKYVSGRRVRGRVRGWRVRPDAHAR